MKNELARKVGFDGTPKLDPYWKSQAATYKVNMEWKFVTVPGLMSTIREL